MHGGPELTYTTRCASTVNHCLLTNTHAHTHTCVWVCFFPQTGRGKQAVFKYPGLLFPLSGAQNGSRNVSLPNAPPVAYRWHGVSVSVGTQSQLCLFSQSFFFMPSAMLPMTRQHPDLCVLTNCVKLQCFFFSCIKVGGKFEQQKDTKQQYTLLDIVVLYLFAAPTCL